MQRYFNVSPPFAHNMGVTLEKRQFILRRSVDTVPAGT